MDRLTAASVLIETIARGSISAAAAHLNMSRAMASRYIGTIEEWAGARLLHRTTRKLSLTAAGEQILPLCMQMLELARAVPDLHGSSADSPTGLLRVAAPSILAEYRLTQVLTDFLALHPAVSIDLQIVDRTTDLAADGIDLAIRVTNDPDPTLIARRLGEVRSIICASPEYLARRGVPSGVRDLTAHNCLTYAYYSSSQWHFSTQEGDVSVPVSGNFSTNEASVVVRAALNSTGIALLPEFAASGFVRDGRLIRLMPDAEAPTLGIFALYLSRDRMPNAMRTLIDYLVGALSQDGTVA